MKRLLRNYLVPHAGNDHAPHLLRSRAIIVMLLLIFIGELGYIGGGVLFALPGSGYLASILPSVLVDLTNANRSANAASPLIINPALQEAARRKAEDMAAKSYFAHVSPEGLSPWHWFDIAGYKYAAAGENLAVNFTDSVDVENAWMNSTGHRENILNNVYTEIGIAAATGAYKGKEAVFVVQMFGRPAERETASVVSKPLVAPLPAPAAAPSPASAKPFPDVVPLEIPGSAAPEVAIQTTSIAGAATLGQPVVPAQPAPQYASFIKRILSTPALFTNAILALFAALVSAVFIYWIIRRFRFVHPVMVTESLVFVGIVFALIFVNNYLSLLGAQIL